MPDNTYVKKLLLKLAAILVITSIAMAGMLNDVVQACACNTVVATTTPTGTTTPNSKPVIISTVIIVINILK